MNHQDFRIRQYNVCTYHIKYIRIRESLGDDVVPSLGVAITNSIRRYPSSTMTDHPFHITKRHMLISVESLSDVLSNLLELLDARWLRSLSNHRTAKHPLEAYFLLFRNRGLNGS